VLDDIIARKRADVEEREARVSYEELGESAVPTTRGFGKAIDRPGNRFILECKRASPSAGVIRPNFDIAEIARAYDGMADAVSVLTDEPFFGGSFDHLDAAREILDVPILCKDFVTGTYQVREARVHGADAVLLILSAICDGVYKECALEASRLGMDVLTEVHSEAELERAISLGAKIIGINNRNLKTLEVDLDVTKRLASAAPRDRVIVCESGISSHWDVIEMSGYADAFLVGGLLMKSTRTDLAARRLIYGGVKICGLTTPEAAKKSYDAGACFGGLIFAEESPRRVGEREAAEIAAASPLPMVGVFVNDDIKRMVRLVEEMNLAAVQLHGEETPDVVSALRAALPKDCEVWKAFRVSDGMPDIGQFQADRALLDSFGKDARGGVGSCFDWSMLDGLSGKDRLILAGGITPGNAWRASTLGCHAIDVNSGVERDGSPGVKECVKIDRLFDALRGAPQTMRDDAKNLIMTGS
jgi:indole-3-glycerol phosphate synthase/phosphoribosylanthranilate isomerase